MRLHDLLNVIVAQLFAELGESYPNLFRRDLFVIIQIYLLHEVFQLLVCQDITDVNGGAQKFIVINLPGAIVVKLSYNFFNLVWIEGTRDSDVGNCFRQFLLGDHVVIVFIDILKLFPEFLKLVERLFFYQNLDELPLQDGSTLESFEILEDGCAQWSLPCFLNCVLFNPGVFQDLRGVNPLVYIYGHHLF